MNHASMPSRALLALTLLQLASCSVGPPPSEPPPPAPSASVAATSEPVAPSAPEQSARPAASVNRWDPPLPPRELPQEKKLSPLERPRSRFTIGGASLSDIEPSALVAALKKLGYKQAEEPTLSTNVAGLYEAVELGIEKGGAGMVVVLFRPTRQPVEPSPPYVASTFEPKNNADITKDNPSLVALYDDKGDVAVLVHAGVPERAARARALLDALVKRPR